MKKNTIIIGAGGHSRVVVSIIKEKKGCEVEIFDLNNLGKLEMILGIQVRYTIKELNEYVENKKIEAYLAIGDNKIRKLWWEKIKKNRYTTPNLISKYAKVSEYAEIGEGNIICSNAFIGPECKIGSNNIINTGATIEHEVSIGSHCHISSNSTVAGRCIIGDENFLGANSTVIEGITIAPKNILGAGGVLVRNINSINKIYKGIPAKE